jgi:hypothetical protein
MNKKDIKIIIPCYSESQVLPGCRTAIDNLQQAGYDVAISVHPFIEAARNRATDLSKEKHFYIDADIGFTVEQFEAIAFDDRYEVLSGAYSKYVSGDWQGLPNDPEKNNVFVAANFDKEYPGIWRYWIRNDSKGIIPVDCACTGFLCVKSSILQLMAEYSYYPFFYKPKVFHPSYRFKYEHGSEDAGFYLSCKALEIQPYINCDVKVDHLVRSKLKTFKEDFPNANE